MGLMGAFLAMLIAFLIIDAIALKLVLYPLFSTHIGPYLRENVQFGVALAFYVFYVAGVLYFAVLPSLAEASLGRAILNGALLGLMAYGTYEATNMATIRGWSMTMVAVDVTWGAILTATVAAIGHLAGRALI